MPAMLLAKSTANTAASSRVIAEARITMATTDGKTAEMAIAELLPGAFDQAQMDRA